MLMSDFRMDVPRAIGAVPVEDPHSAITNARRGVDHLRLTSPYAALPSTPERFAQATGAGGIPHDAADLSFRRGVP